MNTLISLVLLLIATKISDQLYIPEKDISIELTPLKETNETLIQEFQCNSDSHVKKLSYYKYFPTKISCNDWSYKKSNTSFNVTIGHHVHFMELNHMNTFSAHVKGQLVLVQSGPIKEGVCAGGNIEKIVFNKVDPKACDGNGAALQTTLYASVQIDGGFCQAFCFGQVTVKFSPGITNS